MAAYRFLPFIPWRTQISSNHPVTIVLSVSKNYLQTESQYRRGLHIAIHKLFSDPKLTICYTMDFSLQRNYNPRSECAARRHRHVEAPRAQGPRSRACRRRSTGFRRRWRTVPPGPAGFQRWSASEPPEPRSFLSRELSQPHKKDSRASERGNKRIQNATRKQSRASRLRADGSKNRDSGSLRLVKNLANWYWLTGRRLTSCSDRRGAARRGGSRSLEL
jgi:hypothetical protein